ncbi:ribose 5-phosphate isomerase B [Candidatus Dependentiae bacterium]|nr:ribose 5-phosphate isomerase B [Candidatus Dependentiae bacterium]
MKIVIASDHGGFELKEKLKLYLLSKGYEVRDIGTYSESSVDYPDYGFKAGEIVASGQAERGIVICGSGIGISIAANKVKGIRAALCHSAEYAKLSREHNNANVLALGGRFLSYEEANEIVEVWLNTEFSGGRHQKRVDKLTECNINGNK